MKAKPLYVMLRILLLSVFSLTILYPLLWMLGVSLKDQKDMFARPWSIVPQEFLWTNFSKAWTVGKIGQSMGNTAFVTVVTLLFIVVFCYLASYALARIEFRGRKLILTLFISTMLLPIQIILIPLYRIQKSLHLIDSLWGLILPYIAIGLPISIFLMTAFLRSVPFELEESASIDGANRLQLIYKIMLPLSRPGLATVVILQFMTIWNEFPLALIVINNPELRTITLALSNFKGLWGMMDFNKLFAALVITTLPVIAMFIIFQRQFISGLTSGALKG
ncbi:ABC transporter permease [Cohnella abietis]|uniref:ABC transporter permease n=2 Tax=Cohnella abietis TaxID=2507935 RepID=A0A3T1DFB1_9BACL|nr:ABC transporter permease [Cohnella abietis]